MAVKTVDPKAHAFPADDQAAFGKQIFDIGRAQREPMIDSDRISDNLTRETKPIQPGNKRSAISIRPNTRNSDIKQLGNALLGYLVSVYKCLSSASDSSKSSRKRLDLVGEFSNFLPMKEKILKALSAEGRLTREQLLDIAWEQLERTIGDLLESGEIQVESNDPAQSHLDSFTLTAYPLRPGTYIEL